MNTRALPDPATEPTLIPNRVALILGVSRTAVYDAIGRGEIPSLRVGRSVRVPTRLFLATFFPAELAAESDKTPNPNPSDQGKRSPASPNLTTSAGTHRPTLAPVPDSTAA